MATTDFGTLTVAQKEQWSSDTVMVTMESVSGVGKLMLGEAPYPKPPSILPPEVKEMLSEKRKRVFALKTLLEAEEASLRVYERMLSE